MPALTSVLDSTQNIQPHSRRLIYIEQNCEHLLRGKSTQICVQGRKLHVNSSVSALSLELELPHHRQENTTNNVGLLVQTELLRRHRGKICVQDLCGRACAQPYQRAARAKSACSLFNCGAQRINCMQTLTNSSSMKPSLSRRVVLCQSAPICSSDPCFCCTISTTLIMIPGVSARVGRGRVRAPSKVDLNLIPGS